MLYSEYYISKNKNPNYKFVNWINKIEEEVIKIFGLCLLDLPDEPYMISFEEKYSPKEIVEIIKKNNSDFLLK